MLCFPNCKINIGLYVTRKRADGYHDIETIFYPVQWRDVLELIPAQQTRLHTSGIAVAGNDQDNLVWKAYRLMQERFAGAIPGFDIYLHKIIPMGAGLGGGSADGAFMLRLINDHCKLNLTNDELAALALQLGSDCPFFIYNTPRFAAGRGEQMTEVPLDLSAYSIQIVRPHLHISTADAFAMIKPAAAAYDLRQLSRLPIGEWRANIGNDFEQPVFGKYHELAEIKQQLYDQGAVYASMSGSGSALFGIFNKDGRAEMKLKIPFDTYYQP